MLLRRTLLLRELMEARRKGALVKARSSQFKMDAPTSVFFALGKENYFFSFNCQMAGRHLIGEIIPYAICFYEKP